jgi:hypothetical protein
MPVDRPFAATGETAKSGMNETRDETRSHHGRCPDVGLWIRVVGFVIFLERCNLVIDQTVHEVLDEGPKTDADQEHSGPLDSVFGAPTKREECQANGEQRPKNRVRVVPYRTLMHCTRIRVKFLSVLPNSPPEQAVVARRGWGGEMDSTEGELPLRRREPECRVRARDHRSAAPVGHVPATAPYTAKLHFLAPSVPACLIVRSSESTLIMTATSFRRKNCFRLVLCSAIKMTAAW